MEWNQVYELFENASKRPTFDVRLDESCRLRPTRVERIPCQACGAKAGMRVLGRLLFPRDPAEDCPFDGFLEHPLRCSRPYCPSRVCCTPAEGDEDEQTTVHMDWTCDGFPVVATLDLKDLLARNTAV